MEVKIIQLHKRSSYEFKYIQDKYAYNLNKGCFALSDGTTQSYYSEIWAEILTKEFVAEPIFEAEALISFFTTRTSFYKSFKFPTSNNPAKASIEKTKQKNGATATFLGIQFVQGKLLVLSCGDCNLFICRGDKVLPFPFENTDELDNNQFFINTEALLQNKVQKEFFQTSSIDLVENDVVVLATDALSRLVLTNPDVLRKINAIKSFDEMHSFCLGHWNGRTLQEDDISAIVIYNNKEEGLKEILPPSNFSFPKEVLPEFIPSLITKEKELQLNEQEMKEIINHLNHITQDLFYLKRKKEINQLFYLIAMGLLALNILFMVWIGFFKSERPSPTVSSTTVSKETNQLLNRLSSRVESLENLLKKNQSKIDNLITADAALDIREKKQKEEPLDKVKDVNGKKDKKENVLNQ